MKKMLLTGLMVILVVCLYVFSCRFDNITNFEEQTISHGIGNEADWWKAPDTSQIPDNEFGQLVRYGRELIVNTSYYLGPHGTVAVISNDLNCQNCHLEAGTKPWGNNFGAVASLYPKYRERSGTIESIGKKINDCFERSMNGKPIDSSGKEMRSMIAYMQWLGSNVKRGLKPPGTGLIKLPYLEEAADTMRGKLVFVSKCMVCHGENGEGKLNTDNKTYLYPPLWGAHSYNTGAGIYRIAKFASFVKFNMPFGITAINPILTDKEAWDVAAYVNSKPRPFKEFKEDWPDLSRKPVDHPFGPYLDSFSEQQHKYGPFGGMKK